MQVHCFLYIITLSKSEKLQKCVVFHLAKASAKENSLADYKREKIGINYRERYKKKYM